VTSGFPGSVSGGSGSTLSWAAVALTTFGVACDARKAPPRESEEIPSARAVPRTEPPPRELYLPDRSGSDLAPHPSGAELNPPRRVCPPEMVLIEGRFCIDRYEVRLEAGAGVALSPHYPPTPLAKKLHASWVDRAPTSRGRLGLLPVPEPWGAELLAVSPPRAISEKGVLPQGYLSKVSAERACSAAGKRLCTEPEWLTACAGERRTPFPYGARYEFFACNVHRATHPAALLHGTASENHLDPRLLLTYDEDGPLLRKTGETSRCKSVWGDDAVYDMVGNVDEWIDAPGAVFVGGFFSRGTTQGCLSRISSHLPDYFDYSLGTRCCRDSGRLPEK
jgi:formylglycine-generating enzyme